MRRGSIALNVFAFSALWLVVALAATAFLLTELYSRSLDTSLVETLDFQIESLVGIALQKGPEATAGSVLGDPRFSRPASGWYWQITDASGKSLSFSNSLIGSVLPKAGARLAIGGRTERTLTDAFGTRVRMVSRTITIANAPYTFTVTGNLDEIYALVAGFRGQILFVLGAVGVMLAVMSALVARFALRPVTRLRKSLERVREGESTEVDGAYPAELAPLADELNALLRSNSQIIDRARNQVGNLAHGLKTPIAVLGNEAAGKQTQLARIVRTETQKMTDIVATYLDRARLSARTAIVGRRADTGAVLTRLVRVMEKIHPEREVALILDENGTPWFRGEESDLEEMAGNLIDNACKWARSEVRIATSTGSSLVITVEDDGPGLDEKQIASALRRGVRLDEKMPGSGLGLDIVLELATVYGGALELGASDLGGLAARLSLPSARPRGE